MGICEKHQLPLDSKGECELCRLNEMPSQAPPERSAWWAVIIPLVLVMAGIAWAFSSFGSKPEGDPQRGVQTAAPQPASPAPASEEPPEAEPEAIPEPPRPPVPGRDVPIPGDELPVPGDEIPPPTGDAPDTEPSPESTQLEHPTEPTAPVVAGVPEWKWDLARRQVMITMYATQWCGVCGKARDYMNANRIDFTELDTDQSSAASARLGELNPRKTIPTFQIDEIVYVGFREDLFEAKLAQAARKHL